MKNHELIKELNKEPIITKASIKKILGCKDEYAYTVLTRLKNRNIIKQIKKGKYTTLDDIHIIATNIYTPSYLCLWSASAYKGYTEQILKEIQVAVTKKHKQTEYLNYRITPIKYLKKTFFGYKKIKQGDHAIFITEDEKLLIDSLLYPQKMGNPEEIKKIFENAKINEEKLINYLKKINNKTLTKKCGFLLEKTRGIDLSNNLPTSDRNYTQLFFKKGKKTDKKWGIKHDL